MKRIVLLLIALLAMGSEINAQTRFEKAKVAIRNYLRENLDDYKSYEPVRYSKLDSLFTSIEDDFSFNVEFDRVHNCTQRLKELGLDLSVNESDERIDRMIASANSILAQIEAEPNKYVVGAATNFKLQKIELESLKRYNSYLKKAMDNFKPKFVGWKMKHKFRSKNTYGGTTLGEYLFEFDKNIKVINMKYIEE